jgi:AcrR family transcriptional regulator
MTLRADAQRNLGRVLDAAAEVFAERGPDVSMDEIARRAGVGHATVFRRFPNKEALIEAVLNERLGELTAAAEAALSDPDAGEALTRFVWHAGELQARDRSLHDCYGRCAHSTRIAELEEAVARLVSRAQDAGAVRSDIEPGDVRSLLGAAIKAAPRDQWRRYVEVVLDGLRPQSR